MRSMPGVVPGLVGFVEQVQHRQHLEPRAHGRADEPMQRPRAERDRAALLESFHQPIGAVEHLFDDPLVVFHGRALSDDQRDHAGALQRHLVEREHAVGHGRHGARVHARALNSSSTSAGVRPGRARDKSDSSASRASLGTSKNTTTPNG